LRQRAIPIIVTLLCVAAASLLVAGMSGSIAVAAGGRAGPGGQVVRGPPDTRAAAHIIRSANSAPTDAPAEMPSTYGSASGLRSSACIMTPASASAPPVTKAISARPARSSTSDAASVDGAAMAGAVTIALLLYLLARRDMRSGVAVEGGTSMLLLTGTIMQSASMALVTLMLSIAPEGRLRSMVFWMIGDLAGAPLRILPWIVLAAALVYALRNARAMNMLALHAEAAATLGVRVGAVRKGLFFVSAVLTASAVTSAGAIGFVGLIVPHACRFAFGPDHRVLIPAAVLGGGSLLVLCDTVARTVVAPTQLPVGAITALIGAPVFLYQLHRMHK
jgi:iron complex transport system permease protein